MRTWLTISLLVCILLASAAAEADMKGSGVSFSIGFESYPGEFFYRLDGVRYLSGIPRDYKFNPNTDGAAFSVLSLRARKMVPLGSGNVSAGIEVGMSLPISGYEKSWSLPALTPKFTGDIYYAAFC